MNYLNKYKVGSPFFRTLSEGRMQFNILRNIRRYSHPAPTAIIKARDDRGSNSYEKCSEARVFPFPKTIIEPEAARPLLEKETQAEFTESFVLRLPNGRVLGDGTVVSKDNCILSETTTDFHRKQEHHHLLSEIKVPLPERFDGRLAVIASPGSENYFHWTLDSVPRLSLLQHMDDEIDAYYINNRSPFHREWLGMLGIPEKKIFPADPERHIQATELIVPSFNGLAGLPSPEGLDFVRSFMLPAKKEGKRIYISRSGARRRRLLNENEILPILKKYGFKTVYPGEMTLAEQMKLFASASIVVSPHGAELTNLAYCPAGTTVIELLSPYYLNPCFKQLAAIRDLQHIALVGNGGKRALRKQIDTHHVWANMRIRPLMLETTLKSMLT
ncbi:MAG: glycosyltransferase family 61 protein [Pontiella sp.]